MCLPKRCETRALLAVMGVATLLSGCGNTTGSGSRRPDAGTPGTGGNGGINSGTGGMGIGGAKPDAGMGAGGGTSPGTGGAKLDAGLATGGGAGTGGTGTGGGKSDGGTGTGGVGGTKPDAGPDTDGVHLDANLGTGGLVDAPLATGGGGGTTAISTGGIAGGGGTDGVDARNPVLDGKVLACDEIPGPCTSTSLSNYSTPAVTSTTEYFYDDLGQLVRQTSTSSNGSISTYFYAYDQAGRMIEQKSDSCDTVNRIGCYWHTYTYDEKGHLLVDNDMGNSASAQPGCTRYTYNSDELLVRMEFFPGCSTMAYGTVTYEYDSAKRLVAEHSTKEEFLGTSSNIAYEYDGANQVIGETYTNKTGAVTATITYTRNAAGQVLVRESRYADGGGDQTIFTYNAKGMELTRKTVALSDGKETRCFSFTYDNCGTNELTSVFSEKCDGAVSTQSTDSYACFGGP